MRFFREKRIRERHFGKTPDGWNIALHRIPQRRVDNGHPPVFLCHGLGANRYNLDAPGDSSLAQWLWNQGYECWIVELRGAGESSRPRRGNDLEWDWTFDDYVTQDIPTALEVIERVTGHKQVHWIGHSMGGMIGYAYLLSQQPERIRSLTTIGSPSFSRLGNRFFDRILGLKTLVKQLKRLPYEGTGAAIIPTMPLFRETFGRLVTNPRNISNRDLMKMIYLIPSDLPTSLLMQLADWYSEGGFTDVAGQVRYCDELDRIKTPSLVVAGAVDRLTPEEEITHVYESLGSEDKELLVLSRANGCRHDYGHIDPVFGRWASSEVWPAIRDWIASH